MAVCLTVWLVLSDMAASLPDPVLQKGGIVEDDYALATYKLLTVDWAVSSYDFARCLRHGRHWHVGFDTRVDQHNALCLNSKTLSEAESLGLHFAPGPSVSCDFVRNQTAICEWFTEPSAWQSYVTVPLEFTTRDFPHVFGKSPWVSGLDVFWSCCAAVRRNPYRFFQRILTSEIRISFPAGDIGGHLMFLRTLAAKEGISKIVEFGTRKGTSTLALFLGLADQSFFLGTSASVRSEESKTSQARAPLEMISYDVIRFRYRELFEEAGRLMGISYSQPIQSSLAAKFASTDILFIDTIHTYGQLRRELALHHHAVKKYIVLHDTELFAETARANEVELLRNREDSASWPEEDLTHGLRRAVNEFLRQHLEWQVMIHFPNDSGLTVLARRL
eukprot:gb/GFBE01073766.1/.p1 GENE.gb/GFBE01073766.1/~~gb/GFBE01073766.1/.p1  ORF type:complete len:390 (+),score=29.33 gb/GFBE01073766.1/:1-1170(+)